METSSTTSLWQLGAQQLAAAIQSGEASSREVVQAHLDRIEAVNPSVNALHVTLAEQALAGADAARSRGRRRGFDRPAAWRSGQRQGERRRRGDGHDLGARADGPRGVAERRPGGREPPRRRRDPDLTGKPARPRPALAHRQRADGRHDQPVGPGDHARGLERRRGGGAGDRDGAARGRQRPRWIAALAVAVQRDGGAAPKPGPRSRRERDPADRWSAGHAAVQQPGPHGAARGGPADRLRSDDRPEPARSLVHAGAVRRSCRGDAGRRCRKSRTTPIPRLPRASCARPARSLPPVTPCRS